MLDSFRDHEEEEWPSGESFGHSLDDLTEQLNILNSWLIEGVGRTEVNDISWQTTETVQYERKNLHDLSRAEGRKLRQAFRSLNRRSNRVWGRFVFMHQLLGSIAHSTAAAGTSLRFLPWHRLMVWSMEQAIRRTRAGRNLTIPYWTWWQDSGSPRKGIPTAWARFNPRILMPSVSDTRDRGFQTMLRALERPGVRRAMGWRNLAAARTAFGGIGTSSIAVRRSPFSNLVSGSPVVSREPRTLGRSISLPGRQDIRDVLRHSTFADFTENFEQIHGTPHVWVGFGAPGGDGALGIVDISPSDCLFYFHHAEVDRIWHLWQQRHRVPFTGSVRGTELPPWNPRIVDVWDIAGPALGFNYQNRRTDKP